MRTLVVLICCMFSVISASPDNIRRVDFKNFSYPWSQPFGSPEKMEWLSTSGSDEAKLVNMTWQEPSEDEKNSPLRFRGLTFESVQFGDVTGDSKEEAIVVLRYDSGGTRYWHYVYIYMTELDHIKLLGYFHTGERADFGLYRVYVQGGSLVTELYDPRKREGDCCSHRFVRLRYRWRNGNFANFGSPELGTPKTSSRMPVSAFGNH